MAGPYPQNARAVLVRPVRPGPVERESLRHRHARVILGRITTATAEDCCTDQSPNHEADSGVLTPKQERALQAMLHVASIHLGVSEAR
jgi:hypothetical protein